MPDREGRVGAALLVALLALTLLVGALVYRARTPDLALEVTQLRTCLDRGESAQIEFFVRFDEPDATVQMVAAGQIPVRTLDASRALIDGESVRYEWDGRDDDDGLVPAGRYRLRVVLPGQRRDMVYPTKLTVTPRGGQRAGVCDRRGAHE